jgi:hypothetical protein
MHHIIFGPHTLRHDLVAAYVETVVRLQASAREALDGNVDERSKAYIDLAGFSKEVGRWRNDTLKLFAEWRSAEKDFTVLVEKWNEGKVYGFTTVKTHEGERAAAIANTDRGILCGSGDASTALGWIVMLGRLEDLGLSKP